jgi:hypothetical protein
LLCIRKLLKFFFEGSRGPYSNPSVAISIFLSNEASLVVLIKEECNDIADNAFVTISDFPLELTITTLKANQKIFRE